MNSESVNDLDRILFNDNSVKDVEVHYKSGQIINGFVVKVQMSPPEVVLGRPNEIGDNSFHSIDFSMLKEVILTYKDGVRKILK